MSNFCDCCPTDAAYVQGHLNWNVADVYAEDEIRAFTAEDWLREARECIKLWKANGDPVRIPEDKLAELLEEVNAVPI